MSKELWVPGEAVEVDPAEVEESLPHGGDLVVQEPEDVFRVLDRHDEEQILQEMQQRVLDVTLYDFTQGGKRQVDLSYKGVREVVALMNRTGKARIGIVRDSIEWDEFTEDGESYYRAQVWAEDGATGAQFSGMAIQEKVMTLRNGSKKWDRFALTKAVNKAERNALDKFIPEPIRQTLIGQYVRDPERVKVIQTGGEAVAQLPPPLTTEEAEQLRQECRGVYVEIRALPGGSVELPPGKFNALLTRSEWSIERLRELVAQLEGIRDRLANDEKKEAKGDA